MEKERQKQDLLDLIKKYQKAHDEFCAAEKTKKVRIEWVEDRLTGTLYEMEVEDE